MPPSTGQLQFCGACTRVAAFTRLKKLVVAIQRTSAASCRSSKCLAAASQNLVGDGVGLVGEARHRLGERERGPLGVAVVRRLAPGGDGEDALVAHARLAGGAGARVDARAAAVDLARAEVDELERLLRHPGAVSGLDETADRGHDVGEDRGRVLNSGWHLGAPCHNSVCGSVNQVTIRREGM